MTEAEHIAPDGALFIVALDDDDPEKQRALSHAHGCEPCQLLLRESERMLVLLDHEAVPEPLPPGLEARVQAAVLGARRPAARPATTPSWERWAWGIAAAISLGLIGHDAHAVDTLSAGVGVHCLRFELGFGMLAFGAGFLSMHLGKLRVAPLQASLFAMGGALFGQLLLRGRCEAAHAGMHLLVYHFAGVLLAAAIGAAAGGILKRV